MRTATIPRWGAGAALAIVLLIASCTAEPASAPATAPARSSATVTPETPTSTMTAVPDGAPSSVASTEPVAECGDDQTGRYTEEIFEPATIETVEYAPDLQADVYQPAADPASCRVGIVWIHGGGFTEGTRDGGAELAWGDALARRGYVLASIDYRLGVGNGYGIDQAWSPDRLQVIANAVADGQSALAWIRGAGGDEFALDPARIAVGGTSAGAMTTLGVGLTAPPPERPCGLVSVAGDMDPTWDVANPPATLLLHGTVDFLVPYRNALETQNLLIASGGDATLETLDGAGHELAGVPTPQMITTTADWLADHVAAECD